MTKLEFIDKINDILIGLNTAESDALGSLYDELMRDAGWHPASEPPEDEEEVIAAGDYSTTRAVFHEGKYYIAEYYYNPESLNCALNGVKWWCCPPEKK